MRRFKILLPLYFILLACMPCADEADSGMDWSQETTLTASHAQDHECGSEACSPFCSCNCCGQRVPAGRGSNLASAIDIEPVLKITTLQSFSLQNVLQQIWQPPQLV